VIQNLKGRMMTNALTSKAVLAISATMLIMFASNVSGVTVGVKQGDWAKYGDFSASWNSNMPGETKPPEIDEWVNTEWAKFTVQSVSNTVVTVQSVTHYKNGTEKTLTQSGDIAAGSGNITFFIIPANLGQGDTIPLGGIVYPGGIPTVINNTVTRTYAGAQREANHIGYHVTMSGIGTIDFDIYWDRATGILCEYSLSMSMSTMGYTTSETMQAKIGETNLWAGGIIPGVPDYLLYIIIAVVTIVVVIVAIMVLRRRKAPPPTITPLKEEPTAAPSKEE